MCGATQGQKDVGAAQTGLLNQLTTQAKSVFGASSSVFQSLVNTFTPTVQAGPNQQGFSPAELAARQSAAITQTGQAYKNAKAAVGNQEAAFGGGNTALPSGTNTQSDIQLAEAGANQTSSELNQIQQENYATGRENYQNAVTGLARAPDVFNPATGAGGTAIGAGTAAANTQNQIASQNNSWVSAVGGILGSVAGAATGGLLKGFGAPAATDTTQIAPDQAPYGANSD